MKIFDLVRQEYGPDFPRSAWKRNRLKLMLKYQGHFEDGPYYVMHLYRQPWKKAR